MYLNHVIWPRREKTCLCCVRTSKAQTSLCEPHPHSPISAFVSTRQHFKVRGFAYHVAILSLIVSRKRLSTTLTRLCGCCLLFVHKNTRFSRDDAHMLPVKTQTSLHTRRSGHNLCYYNICSVEVGPVKKYICS